MGRNLDPKCKQCRRAGEKLFLKGERCYTPNCAIVKRNFPPGFHGQKGKKRQSDYGMQLAEKQKAQKQYNLMEKQFRLTFAKAKKKTGDAGENLLRLLESRLDNAIYRTGFASSRAKARQLVGHGHFEVNNRKVSIPSYEVKEGDVIKVRELSKKFKIFKELPEKLLTPGSTTVPSWLNIDAKALSAKVLHQPKANDLKFNINAQVIVEFYSK